MLEERGLDEVVRALAATIGGAVLVLSARGETMAGKAFRRELGDDAAHLAAAARWPSAAARRAATATARAPQPVAFAPEHPDLAGRALALPVATRGSGAPQAWLVAVRDAGGLGDFERLILQQAVTVVALELMRQRVMRDTERRLAGDVLAEALTGQLDPDELQAAPAPVRHRRHRRGARLPASTTRAAAEALLDRFMAGAGVGALVATREALAVRGGRRRRMSDPLDLARRARKALGAEYGEVRAAASRPAPPRALRRSFHEARCALEAVGAAATATRRTWPPTETSAPSSCCSRSRTRTRCGSTATALLGPLENGEGDYGDELLRSLEVFIEQNGQWERAASAALLPPPHAALPDPPRRGADRPRPRPARATGSSSGWRCAGGSSSMTIDLERLPDEGRSPDRDQDRRVPRRDHARGRARARRARARGARSRPAPARAARSPTTSTSAQGARIVPDAAGRVRRGRAGAQGQGAAGPRRSRCCAPEHTLFTYLHLAPAPELTQGLCDSGATCIAYETVEDAQGRLPLLAPMSEVAGKIATQAGAFMLEKPLGGRGILLGGVPGVAAATVLVIGGGVVGMNAAFIAIGMEADVFVFDRNIDRLRELDVAFGGRASTVYSSTLAIEEMLPRADLVIGAVLIHGARAPHVITREQLVADEAAARCSWTCRSTRAAASRPRARRRTRTRPTRSTASRTTA